MPLVTPFTGDPNTQSPPLKPKAEGGDVETLSLVGSGQVHLFARVTSGTADLLVWVWFAGRWYPHPAGAATVDSSVKGGAFWDRLVVGDLRGLAAVQKTGSGTIADGGKVRLEEVSGG